VLDRARTARAFSPSRNLRALFSPDARHLAPLDGLRAIAILWTMSFHTAWFSFVDLPHETYGALLLEPTVLFAWRGHFGVDLFFVLSGFLIAGILFDEREKSGGLRLRVFYVRRLMRLWPALLVGIVIGASVLDLRIASLWPYALYVGNFVPVAQSRMAALWSLAIEEHFYLVCPWLVDAITSMTTRARLRVLALLVVATCAIGACVVIAGDFHALDTEVVVNRAVAAWARSYDTLYSKPWMRVGPLLAGVAAAVIHRDERVRDAIARSGWKGSLALLPALLTIALAGSWHRFVLAPRWLEVGYMATHRALFGIAAAYVLLLVISQHAVGRAIGRVLSARALYPIAQLAYSSYLLNPLITILVHRRLAPSFADASAATFYFAMLPLDVLATLLGAAAMYVLVERPFMELRPRAPDGRAAPRSLAAQLTAMLVLGVALPLVLLHLVPAIAPPR
jgi:peptidoglycan/LPS O-acetylase OafA/YrhL